MITTRTTKRFSKYFTLSIIFLFLIQCFSYGQGSTYGGPYDTSTPIALTGVSNRTISNLQIANPTGHSISLTNCSNITIQNCKLGPSKMEGVYLYNCTNVTITNCSMEKVESGVLAVSCSGIKFEYNEVKNVQGPFPRGQMIQFAYVSGGGNSISYNVSENILGESYPEDIINMYMSSGTADSPIKISNNWIRGGGPSNSGGGILIGDQGGAYVIMENNILVDPGQYGIGMASGHHLTIRNNKVYAKQQSFTNVGVFAWEQYGLECHDNTISNNEVNYKSASGSLNNWWFAENVGTITGAATNVYNPNMTASILPTQIIGRAATTTTPTYVWNKTTAASFQTSGNWTPARTNPTTKDILQFNSGGSVVVTDFTSQTVGQLQLMNNSKVELQSLAVSNLTVETLVLNAGTSLNITAGNQLTVTTTLTNNGTLNLFSDKTKGTATILIPGTSSGTGVCNVQQYLALGSNCQITSPVTSTSTSVLSSATNVTTFNEPLDSWDNVTGSLTTMKGYFASAIKTDGAITFSGTLNNGDQSIKITRTGTQTDAGFNLVGNPYASYLNLNKLSNNDIEPTIWYRGKEGSQQFDVYNIKSGVSTSNSGFSVTGYAPPMQGFWVKVKKGRTSSTLSLTNAMRSHRDDVNNIFRAPSINNAQSLLLRLQVSNGTSTDQTVIYSDASASNGFDDYDSSKGMNGITSVVPDIYTAVDAENLVINGMSSIPVDTELPLMFAANQSQSKTFTIKASEIINLSNLGSDVRVLLKDNSTGVVTDLTNGTTVYEFTANAATSKTFSVTFKTSKVTTGTDNVGDGQETIIYKNASKQIAVKCNGGLVPEASVSVYNVSGQRLINQHLTNFHTVIYTILPSGVYVVTVNNGDKTKTQKILIN